MRKLDQKVPVRKPPKGLLYVHGAFLVGESSHEVLKMNLNGDVRFVKVDEKTLIEFLNNA